MAKNVNVILTEEETKFVLSALDRVPIQGVTAARLVTLITEKLAAASRFAYEKAADLGRAPIDQALLARVTPIERSAAEALLKAGNGTADKGERP